MRPRSTLPVLAALVGLGVAVVAVGAQEGPVHVGVLPIEFTGDPVDGEFRGQLVGRIADALTRAAGARLTGRVVPPEAVRTAAAATGAAGPEAGWIPNEVLERLSLDPPLDFFLLGRVANEAGVLTGDFQLVSAELRTQARFEVVDLAADPFPLEEGVKDRLVLQLARNIRIAMMEFPFLGGDTVYQRLEWGLPSMLATDLSLSPRLVLLESFARDTLRSERGRSLRSAGIQDRLTALEIGRELQANYYVMGQFWELDDALRVDVRVVSIESGEMVVNRGVSVDPPDLATLETRMERLAAEVRSAIEQDFVEQTARPRYIGVAGFPPYPETAENRTLLAAVIRGLGRKLKVLERDGLRVRESRSVQEAFLSRRQDRWEMSDTLGADVLVSISLDRTDPERPVLDYDVFDTHAPEALSSFTAGGSLEGLDGVLDEIVERVVAAQGMPALSEPERGRLATAPFQGINQGWSFRARVGAAVRSDPALFLDSGGGLALDAGPLWVADRAGHWHLEPMNVRLDVLAAKTDRTVVGLDVTLLTVAHRFLPNRTYNPYVGLSFGAMGVLRIGGGDFGYNGRPGAGVLLGVEHTLSDSRRLTYEIEAAFGLSRVPGQVIGGQAYAEGRPGGVYLTFGTTF